MLGGGLGLAGGALDGLALYAGLLAALATPTWDTSARLPNDSVPGSLLHVPAGCEARPGGMQAATHLATTGRILVGTLRATSCVALAGPAASVHTPVAEYGENELIHERQAKYRHAQASEVGLPGFGGEGRMNRLGSLGRVDPHGRPPSSAKWPVGEHDAIEYDLAVNEHTADPAPRMTLEHAF